MTTPDMSAMDDGLDAALLAELLAEDGFELPSEGAEIARRAASARVFATPAQQRLWTVEQIDGVTLRAKINVERALLQHKALRLGLRIYDERPKRFGRRLRRYWRKWAS